MLNAVWFASAENRVFIKQELKKDFIMLLLGTGQKPHDTLEIGELFMEIEDDISEKVESVPEEAFEGTL